MDEDLRILEVCKESRGPVARHGMANVAAHSKNIAHQSTRASSLPFIPTMLGSQMRWPVPESSWTR